MQSLTLIKYAITILVCNALLGAGFAYAEAQSNNILSEEDYMGEVPRVLTVSRLAQAPADVGSAVTVIDRETIRASGIVDLPEIFRLVPGFYVGANAGFIYSTNHAVSYHGMVSAYAGTMQIMINGRSVYSPLFGGVNWSELPIALVDIDRIEVTRGPNAASYGANAYFGTINIMTEHPADVPANSIISTIGNGRSELLYRHAGKINNFSYRVTSGYRQDDGLENREDFKRTRFINAQTAMQLSPQSELEFEVGITDGERGEGNLREDSIVFLPRTKQMNNYYGLVRWRHNVSDTSDFSLQAYHSYDRSDDETTSVNLRPLLSLVNPFVAANLVNDRIYIDNTVIQKRTDIEAQYTFAAADHIRAVWGGSVRQDQTYAVHYLNSSKTDDFNLQRLFGHIEWRAHRQITMNAGAMVEHNDFTDTDISPRASINFKLHPNHTFRLGISSALRTPNYVEEKFQDRAVVPTRLPNPSALIYQYTANKGNVMPEKITSHELGYMGTIGKLQLDTRIFKDNIKDLIRFRTRTDFTVPANTRLLNPLLDNEVDFATNGGGVSVEGAEFQAKWKFSHQTNLLLNYAYVNIVPTMSGLRSNFIESMPQNTISALLTHRFNQQWDASFAYYQTSEANMIGDGTQVELIRRADARVARKFKTGRWSGEVNAVVENLFNSQYQEFADYNTLERRGRVSLRLDF